MRWPGWAEHRAVSTAALLVAGPRLRRRDVALTFAFVTVLALYLLAPPRVPDLAAQVARTELVHRVGLTVWWQGWFGGLHLPTYSALSPMVMSVLTPPLPVRSPRPPRPLPCRGYSVPRCDRRPGWSRS